jgi:hypothetical protein
VRILCACNYIGNACRFLFRCGEACTPDFDSISWRLLCIVFHSWIWAELLGCRFRPCNSSRDGSGPIFINFRVFQWQFPFVRLLRTQVSLFLRFVASLRLGHCPGGNTLGHAVGQLCSCSGVFIGHNSCNVSIRTFIPNS